MISLESEQHDEHDEDRMSQEQQEQRQHRYFLSQAQHEVDDQRHEHYDEVDELHGQLMGVQQGDREARSDLYMLCLLYSEEDV